jgi:GNAT superfamily N-acetyltransferase
VERGTMNSDKGIKIRAAQKSDLGDMLNIQKSAFARYTEFLLSEQIQPLHETFDEVKEDFEKKTILVVEIKDRLAGSIRYEIKGGVCIIERLSVLPEFQGNGIGRALINEVEKRASRNAHKLYLETGLLANNLLMFYTRLGYSAEAVLRKHYGGFDWIVFSKFIDDEGTGNAYKT